MANNRMVPTRKARGTCEAFGGLVSAGVRAAVKWTIVIGAAVAAVGGCSLHRHDAAAKTAHVVIDGPTIIGFFPTVTDKEIETDDGINSALEHWEWALENAERCFGPKGVHVQKVFADKLLLESDRETIEVTPAFRAMPGIGYYLASPGKPVQLVSADAGPSSLLYFLPKAAAVYFGAPECTPEVLQ